MGGNDRFSLVILGAGNLASHLSLALSRSGYEIRQIYNRSLASATILAEQLGVGAVDAIDSVDSCADGYLLAVKDDAIEPLALALSQLFAHKRDPSLLDPLLIHTSGSVALEAISTYHHRAAVLYPLQTFSRSRSVEWATIPFFVEACYRDDLDLLDCIVKDFAGSVYELDSSKRKHLHLAAVFACNFVNAMYDVAHSELQKADISFDLLYPLILETAEKAISMLPAAAQTGPAIRWDQKVMDSHIELLGAETTQAELYRLVSRQIRESRLPHAD